MRGEDGNIYRGGWVPTDGPPFPGIHAWSSSRYDPDGDAAIIEIGEQRTEEVVKPPLTFLPETVCRACYVGDPDWIETGSWPVGTPPITIGADGWPVDCTGGDCSMCVRSVGLQLPPEFDVAGSPVVDAGILRGTWADVPAGYALMGPLTGPDAAPTFKPFSITPSAPLTLQPPTDGDFGLALKLHSSTQTAPLMKTLDASGTQFGASITPKGEFTNPGPITSLYPGSEAFGVGALHAQTGGANNSAFGTASQFSITGGSGNVSMGTNSLYGTTGGSLNTAVGYNSMVNGNAGDHNTCVGSGSGANIGPHNENTCVGWAAGNGIIANDKNTAIGALSLPSALSADKVTAVGYNSGSDAQGPGSTLVGADTNAGGTPRTNSTAIGIGATLTADNQIMLGTASETVEFPGNAHFANPPTGTGGPNSGSGSGSTSVPTSYTSVINIANTNGLQGSFQVKDTGGLGLLVQCVFSDLLGNTTTNTTTIGPGASYAADINNLPSLFAGPAALPVVAMDFQCKAPSGTETLNFQYAWVGPA